jgi:hypothetical protein
MLRTAIEAQRAGPNTASRYFLLVPDFTYCTNAIQRVTLAAQEFRIGGDFNGESPNGNV